MLEKIEGIVIKTIDYGETGKIITILSKKIGKFTALARGAKKPRSRMAAVAQPFTFGQFFVYINRGLSTVQQGEVINNFRKIKEDIVKTAYTAYITELTDKLLDDKAADSFIYEQLYATMQWISDKEDYEIPIMMYELKLFAKGGFAPIVSHCINCGSNNGPFAFSISEGGLLCNKCSYLDEIKIVLTDTQVKLLQIFQSIGLEQVGEISVKKRNRKLLRQIIDAYYDRYGGFHLKSRRFLNQLEKFNE